MWDKWWVYNFSALFDTFELWPREDMSPAEKLNALTRCLVLIFIILLLLDQDHWAIEILIFGLILIILTGIVLSSQDNTYRPRYYNRTIMNGEMNAPVQQYLSRPRETLRSRSTVADSFSLYPTSVQVSTPIREKSHFSGRRF